MTTMIGWMGLTNGAPSAVYLASDSRITWSAAGRRWDAGRKLFTCRRSADMFGYWGDALFPSQVLGQIVELTDHGLLFQPNTRCDRRHAAVVAALQASHSRRHQAPDPGFEIIHIARQGEGAKARFHAWVTRYSGTPAKWQDEVVELDPLRPLIFGSGTGRLAETIGTRLALGGRDHNAVIFSAFCEGLEGQVDARSGGVPQLVGLFMHQPAQPFGIVHEGARFFYGLPVGAPHAHRLQWRNRDFLNIDGASLKPKRLVRRQDSARTRKALRAVSSVS